MFMYLSVVMIRHLFIDLTVDWIKELYIRNAVWIILTVHVLFTLCMLNYEMLFELLWQYMYLKKLNLIQFIISRVMSVYCTVYAYKNLLCSQWKLSPWFKLNHCIFIVMHFFLLHGDKYWELFGWGECHTTKPD